MVRCANRYTDQEEEGYWSHNWVFFDARPDECFYHVIEHECRPKWGPGLTFHQDPFIKARTPFVVICQRGGLDI